MSANDRRVMVYQRRMALVMIDVPRKDGEDVPPGEAWASVLEVVGDGGDDDHVEEEDHGEKHEGGGWGIADQTMGRRG